VTGVDGRRPPRADCATNRVLRASADAGRRVRFACGVISTAQGRVFRGRDLLENCPRKCPCHWMKRGDQSQRQPNRSIDEVIETCGFARKNGDGRNADRRLANHRLQPLGHLTRGEKAKYKRDRGLRLSNAALDCPLKLSLPAPRHRLRTAAVGASRASIGTQRFFFPIAMQATACLASICPHEPGQQALGRRRVRGLKGVRTW
jgi:hypothetical protein